MQHFSLEEKDMYAVNRAAELRGFDPALEHSPVESLFRLNDSSHKLLFNLHQIFEPSQCIGDMYGIERYNASLPQRQII